MLIAFVLVVATVVLAAGWLGVRRQQAALADRLHRLTDAARDAETVRPHAAAPDLPLPVEQYLQMALPPGTRVSLVRLRQTGVLRTDATSDRWMPFEAEHVASAGAPGFVWNARVRVAPLVHVRVRDAYVEGRGSGHVALLSAFTVGEDAGTPEMNAGALHRYLAEAVWYPAALVPSDRLAWEGIDARAARATLTDRGTTVSLDFRFNEAGEVTGIYTPARWGTFDGGYAQAAWEGRFRDYAERDGLRVPTEGEVGWYIGGEWRMVWKGRITAFERLPSGSHPLATDTSGG